MKTWMWILIGVALVAAAGLIVARLVRRRRLQQRFGPEYEHTVRWSDDRGRAEQELTDRVRQHRDLDLRPLEPRERAACIARWNEIQLAFVELPEGAVREAEKLLDEVMKTRGYPDNRDRVALVSVDHPRATTRFREGLRRGAKADGAATTEDFRGAFVAYRGLFLALLEPAEDEARLDAAAARPGARIPAGRPPNVPDWRARERARVG